MNNDSKKLIGFDAPLEAAAAFEAPLPIWSQRGRTVRGSREQLSESDWGDLVASGEVTVLPSPVAWSDELEVWLLRPHAVTDLGAMAARLGADLHTRLDLKTGGAQWLVSRSRASMLRETWSTELYDRAYQLMLNRRLDDALSAADEADLFSPSYRVEQVALMVTLYARLGDHTRSQGLRDSVVQSTPVDFALQLREACHRLDREVGLQKPRRVRPVFHDERRPYLQGGPA